jgi:hypothetical protein
MASKPMSWTVAALLFAMMMVTTFALDMAFSPSLRHQAASIHSDFWRIAIPADLIADAVLVLAMRAVFNRFRFSRNRTDLNTHPTP